MNLSNAKAESFDVEGISCGGEGRSTAIGFKEILVGGFSRGITLGFFNSSNWGQVFAHSSC